VNNLPDQPPVRELLGDNLPIHPTPCRHPARQANNPSDSPYPAREMTIFLGFAAACDYVYDAMRTGAGNQANLATPDFRVTCPRQEDFR